jgi:hypothetical protein
LWRTPEELAMRLWYIRAAAFISLLTLYLLSPVLGVVVVGVGYTYVLMRHRNQQAIRTDTLVSLNLN